MWGLTLTGGIQRRVGVSTSNPTGTSWKDVKPSGYLHISIGTSGVFGVTVAGNVEHRK